MHALRRSMAHPPHQHIQVLIDGVDSVGTGRVGGGRQHVALAADLDDVRGMASAGALTAGAPGAKQHKAVLAPQWGIGAACGAPVPDERGLRRERASKSRGASETQRDASPGRSCPGEKEVWRRAYLW